METKEMNKFVASRNINALKRSADTFFDNQTKNIFVREVRPRSSKDDAGNRRRGKEHNGRDSKNVTKKALVRTRTLRYRSVFCTFN